MLKNQGDHPGTKRRRCLNLKPKDHKYKIVNSCNGLLCLSEPSRNEPVAVCNPLTGEFINLPKSTCDDEDVKSATDCGLGFSPKSNQYKVIRVFERNTWVKLKCAVDHYDSFPSLLMHSRRYTLLGQIHGAVLLIMLLNRTKS